MGKRNDAAYARREEARVFLAEESYNSTKHNPQVNLTSPGRTSWTKGRKRKLEKGETKDEGTRLSAERGEGTSNEEGSSKDEEKEGGSKD